jgi:hypothetical protein
MTVRSRCNRILKKNRKGFSTVIATIFMVLVVMFLFFNVFMFSQRQDALLQDAVNQSAQLDADRSAEHISFTNVIINRGVNQVTISCSILNDGPLPVQIMRLWVKDSAVSSPATTGFAPPLVLQPGSKLSQQQFTFTVLGASAGDEVSLWFVTARGNVVSVHS